jgi:hypothetical protein
MLQVTRCSAQDRRCVAKHENKRVDGPVAVLDYCSSDRCTRSPVMDGHGALTTLPLELIDHMLSFLPWPFGLHPLLLVNQRLSPIAERALYRNLDELPAQRSVRLLLSLANAPAARREFVKALKVNFALNSMLFALERLIAKVLGMLPHLRTLIVEVSVNEDKNGALAWIFPRDAPFRLRSFETSIRYAWLFLLPLLFLRAR